MISNGAPAPYRFAGSWLCRRRTGGLLLSASENNNYEIADITTTTSPAFYERATGSVGELDSSGEDCATGIALAPAEFSSPSSIFRP